MVHLLRALPIGLSTALLLGVTEVCASSPRPPVESASQLPLPPVIPRALLYESWGFYKQRFIQGDGRVIDHKGGGISTSEGQSYAMFRALWMDDRATFDKAMAWADTNLNVGVRQDHLYAWRWGRAENGDWTVLDPTAAADADILIAYSLILAAKKWKHAPYHTKALNILGDIWSVEVREFSGQRFLLPGDWRDDGSPTIRINPSYYMPFAFRLFASVDPSRPWMELVETTYRVLEHCRSTVGLPADWCLVNRGDGSLSISKNVYDKSSDFGFESFRVYWNLAADHRWHGDPRATVILRKMDWLLRYWIVRRELPQVVTFDGIPRSPFPYLGMYGAALPGLALLDPLEADILYQKAISPAYNAGLWGDPEDYYLQNWIWFGLALQSPIPAPVPPGTVR